MSDIRQDPEVLIVYWQMKGEAMFSHRRSAMSYEVSAVGIYANMKCRKCGKITRELPDEADISDCPVPDPITMSIGDLAFFMRDKCDRDDYINTVRGMFTVDSTTNNFEYFLGHLSADEIILAACKAWEAKQ